MNKYPGLDPHARVNLSFYSSGKGDMRYTVAIMQEAGWELKDLEPKGVRLWKVVMSREVGDPRPNPEEMRDVVDAAMSRLYARHIASLANNPASQR